MSLGEENTKEQTIKNHFNMFSSWHNALRAIPLTEEEVKNSTCTCFENDIPEEFGENSNLPCMSWDPDCDLECKNCIYCVVRK